VVGVLQTDRDELVPFHERMTYCGGLKKNRHGARPLPCKKEEKENALIERIDYSASFR
jgi:hypothetical protein